MPVAVVQDWVQEETDRSTTTYDAIHERLMQGEPIEGFLLHTAGFTGRGFRVFEVWESREHYDRFVEERLMPIVREMAPADSRPPELTVYELHGFAATPQAAEVPAF
jgi:quinol monooxygenase YgiN